MFFNFFKIFLISKKLSTCQSSHNCATSQC